MILISLMCSYFYTDLLYVYFYEKILGRRYSRKITFWGLTVIWMFHCCAKLFPQFFLGIEHSGFMNLLVILSDVIYVISFFNSSITKRILAMLFYFLVQAGMDMTGMKLTSLITGSYEPFRIDSDFTLIAVSCSCFLITLGTYMFVWLWKVISERKWSFKKYQCVCLILPFSQYAILQQTGVRYGLESKAVPAMVFMGLILSFLADIYMFWLFERLNKRNVAKEKLMKLTHQYELEQLRYEQLKETQEEAAKMRHDFQNYIITMRHME